jgi:DNA-directed RNA polymerase specialized sigma24 family protein
MDEGAMGAEQPRGTDSVPPVGEAQMDQVDGNGQFPSNATPEDRRAFAEQTFGRHAAQIYRYVLAWTNDRAAAEELTAQVLRGAVARMGQLSEPDTDLEARLISLARTAVARRKEAADRAAARRDAGAFAAAEPVPFLLDAVGHLDDTRREVVILRLLLGQSIEHAARLLAFDAPVVEELERDACATLWRRVNRAPQTQQVMTWDALTVAAALRQGAPTWLAPPDEAVLARLRARLLDELEPDRRRAAGATPAGEAAAERQGLLASLTAFVQRRRWLLAGCVASAAIGIVAALAMGGQMGKGSSCGAPSCLVSTTAGNVSDTVQSLPPSAPQQSSGLPSTSSRMDGSPAFPAVSSSATVTTTGRMATTTTVVRGTTPGPSSTTRPRATTTTTAKSTTTAGASSTTPPSSTEPPSSTVP